MSIRPKVGKTYVDREGSRIRILSDDGNPPYPIRGEQLDGHSAGQSFSYTADGRFLSSGPSIDDLLAEAPEAPTPPSAEPAPEWVLVPRELVESAREAVAYSHNFATAKPDIGATEKLHILGLAAHLERLTLAATPAPTPTAPQSEVSEDARALGVMLEIKAVRMELVSFRNASLGIGSIHAKHIQSLEERLGNCEAALAARDADGAGEVDDFDGSGHWGDYEPANKDSSP